MSYSPRLSRPLTTVQILLLIGLLGLTFALLVPFVRSATPFYSADMSVVDLMARHFAQGEFRLYYWGQRFYGVLDPLLLIAIFHWFGQSPTSSQLLPLGTLLVLLIVYDLYLWRTSGGWTALAATLLLATPPLFFVQPVFSSYNYGLGSLLGVMLLWLAHECRERASPRKLWMTGLLAGFSFYYYRMITVFFAAILCETLYRGWLAGTWQVPSRAKVGRVVGDIFDLKDADVGGATRGVLVALNRVALLLLAFGGLLWITGSWEFQRAGHRIVLSSWHTLRLALQLVIALAVLARWRQAGRTLSRLWEHREAGPALKGFLIGFSPALIAMVVGTDGSRAPGKIVSLPGILRNLRLFVSEMVPLLVQPTGFLAIVTWLVFGGVAIFVAWKMVGVLRERKGPNLPALVFLLPLSLLLGLGCVDLQNAAHVRYFVAFYLALPGVVALTAQVLARRSRGLSVAMIGLLAVQGALGLTQIERKPDSYPALVAGLKAEGIRGGYAPYWIAYRVAATSHEEILIVPTDEDRYPPYRQFVQTLPKAVLIGDGRPMGEHLVLAGTRYRVEGAQPLAGFIVTRLQRADRP